MPYSAKAKGNPDWFYDQLYHDPEFIKSIAILDDYIEEIYGSGIVRRIEFYSPQITTMPKDIKELLLIKDVTEKFRIQENTVREAVMFYKFHNKYGYQNIDGLPSIRKQGNKIILELSGRINYAKLHKFWKNEIEPLRKTLPDYLGRESDKKLISYRKFMFRCYEIIRDHNITCAQIEEDLKNKAGSGNSIYFKDFDDDDLPPWDNKEIRKHLKYNLPRHLKLEY